MLGDLFKSVFGGGSSSAGAARELAKPSDLRTGDFVTFDFTEQTELSGKRFWLESARMLEFDADVPSRVIYAMEGNSGEIYGLSPLRRDGRETVAVSRRLKRAEVYALFGEEAIGEVIEEGFSEVVAKSVPPGLEGWTAAKYYEHEDAIPACSTPENAADDGERELDYYILEDDQETKAVELEVYQSGETDIYLTVYLPASAIKEMWPGDVKAG